MAKQQYGEQMHIKNKCKKKKPNIAQTKNAPHGANKWRKTNVRKWQLAKQKIDN